MRDEAARNKSRKELDELMNIPEVEDLIFHALEDAKVKHKEKIEDFKNTNRTPNKPYSASEETWQKGKSYFFEVNLQQQKNEHNQGAFDWQLTKFKLKDNQKAVSMIFTSEFYKIVQSARIAPHQTQSFMIKSRESGKSFELDLMKNSVSRVVGFVKEVGVVEDKVISRSNVHQLTMTSKYKGIQKEEMYQKLHQLMEENPDIREDIFFYFLILQESRGRTEMSPLPSVKGHI